MSTRGQRHEQVIQRAVLDHLRLRGAPDLFAFHPANGGYRSPVEAMVLKGLGVTPGVPDILIIHGGKCFGLELKSEHGRVTPAQLDCHERMARAGAVVGVAVGIDQAVEWLERHDLLRGRTQRSGAAENDDWRRFREELAAAPTRDAATDIFYRCDFLFLGLSSTEREARYAEIEDIIREKPTENSHCQVR